MKLNKKAQMTVIMIVGVILIAGTGLFLFARNDKAAADLELQVLKESQVKLNTDTVENFVDSCLLKTLADASFFVASRGGYYEVPSNSLQSEYGEIPFYYDEGKTAGPTLGIIEDQIELYIEENLYRCLDDFSVFAEKGTEINSEEPRADVTIGTEEITAKLHFPLEIRTADGIRQPEEFIASAPIDFRTPYLAMIDIISDVDNIPLAGLTGRGIDVVLLPYDEDVMIYSIYDEDSSIYGRDFLYIFAVRFPPEENQAPIMETIPKISLKAGEDYSGQIIAQDPDGDGLAFDSRGGILIVSSSGKMIIRTDENDIGTRTTTLIVTDGVNEVRQDVEVEVTQ